MQGRVSIVIPIYNVEKYLSRCIESIIAQTYPNWELILVDDGSTDRSREISENYAINYKNIYAYHKENGGVSSARNFGLAKVKGEYVCFVDGDDWIDSYMLEYLLKAIRDDESDMAMCQICITNTYNVESKISYENIGRFTQDNSQYLIDNFLNQGNSCCAKIFKKEILQGLEFQQGLTIGEDMLFLLKARERFKKVSVLNYYGYYYLQQETSAMNQAFKPSFMDAIYCWQSALKELGVCDEKVRNKVKSIIMISVFEVLNKIAYAKEIDGKYERICKVTLRKNIRGWKHLSFKRKIQCCLVLMSTKLYMYVYRQRLNCSHNKE